MKVEVIRKAESFFSLRDKWNEALKRSGSDTFFLRHEWLANWWRCYGAHHELFVVVVTESGEITAAAPMMIFKKKLFGLIWIRKLQFIAHGASDYMDFMICGDKKKYFDVIVGQIKENQDSWDWAEFIYIRDDQGSLDFWREIKSDRFSVLFDRRDVSVVVDIVGFDDYDKYARSLNKKVRQDIVRQRNNIARAGDLSLEIYTSASEIQTLIKDFFRLHRQKWGEQRVPSQFNNALVRGFYLTLVSELDGTELIEFSVLRCGGDIVAMHYGFIYSGRYFWYTPTYNNYYQKYSPGKLMLATLIDSAISRKVQFFDLLRGKEKYKYFWSDKEIDLFSMIFVRNSLFQKAYYLFMVQVKKKILSTALGRYLRMLKQYMKKTLAG